MIFQATLDKVLSGEKTQTRRVVKPDEYGHFKGCQNIQEVVVWKDYPIGDCRLKWKVGCTYAIQPGRGKKAVGRIRITAIYQENLQDITEQDAKAEGATPYTVEGDYPPPDNLFNVTYRWAFEDIWQSLNDRPGSRWEDDPEVWVIEFERVS